MNKIFEAALSINEHCYIKKIGLDSDKKRVDLYIDFKKGRTFKVHEPRYNSSHKVYDTANKTWRHLNFFSMRVISIAGHHG